MKVKLDENLGGSAIALFVQGGHEVETVRGEGMSGYADEDVIAVCPREQRRLVTLDLDFSNPLLFKPADYFGIAVLRLPPKPTPADLRIGCETLLRAMEQSDIVGKLWSVERWRVREYRPDEPDNP